MLPPRDRDWRAPGSELVETARGDEPGAAVVENRQARRGSRSADAGIRGIHRGIRYERSARGESDARRIECVARRRLQHAADLLAQAAEESSALAAHLGEDRNRGFGLSPG